VLQQLSVLIDTILLIKGHMMTSSLLRCDNNDVTVLSWLIPSQNCLYTHVQLQPNHWWSSNCQVEWCK